MQNDKLRTLTAKKIKQLRIEQGLTQEQAAELTGFHYKYFQKIETGKVNLTLDSIGKISKAFKVKPSDLLKF